jgi:hypothetical protein
MLTGESIEQAEQRCIDRFGADLDEWLKRQEDEQAIRKSFNQMRG